MTAILPFLVAACLVPSGLSQENSQCTKCQSPRARASYEPVLYPEDYCKQIKDNEEFDYVVVGAGPGGATVARRLAEDKNRRVLLIEAGGDPIPTSDIPSGRGVTQNELWDISTEPSDHNCVGYPNNSCPYLYAKFLGGTSVVNLMMYARGNHKDYDEWAQKAEDSGWSWKSMFPYFLKLENFKDPRGQVTADVGYHRQGGPFTTAPSQIDPQTYAFKQGFMKALKNQKVVENNDPNGKSQIGYGDVTGLLEENGYRDTVARAYLLYVPDNFKVCKQSIVSRVVIENNVAVAVEFTYNNTNVMEKKTVRATREHILSGGPISSPQILERSGIGRKEVLEKAGVPLVKELRGVGENLQEQFTNIGCAFNIDMQTVATRNPLSLAMTSFTIFLNMTDYSNPIPDLQWIFVPYSPNYMHFKPEIGAQFMAINSSRYIFMAGSTILRQTNPGYVHIVGTDPTKSPLFNPNQFTSPEETFVTSEGCRLMRRALMNESSTAKFDAQPIVIKECSQYAFNSDEEIMCGAKMLAFPTHHIAGTTTMGPASNPNAVVDSNLKVHGIDKLRISDLGVMPGVSRANTEIPTIAVSERAADIIKKAAMG